MKRFLGILSALVLVFSLGVLGLSSPAFAQSSEVWVDDDWAEFSPSDLVYRHVFLTDAFATTKDTTLQTRLQESYGKLPLSFEANQGQTDAQIKFLSRGNGYTLFLTPTEAVLTLRKPAMPMTADAANTQATEHAVLRMQLVEANPEPDITGLQELPGKSNYFIGNDPQQWYTNVSQYAKVWYQHIYPGVDLVYYGNQRQLEYDFIVAPGADPDAIQLGFEGAGKITINDQGNLILHVDGGKVILNAPVMYQDIEGVKRTIRGSYMLQGKNRVGFEVAAYDTSRPLVIDPVLVYSTYLGGSDGDYPRSRGIAVDADGNAYVIGGTMSIDFPTVDPVQPTHGGQAWDSFVAKLNATGSGLVYSTYLGGKDYDEGAGIAVDADGNAYVTGTTTSIDFPTTNPLQAAIGGSGDAFVVKLNADGSDLVYSSYLGGSDRENGNDITVDGDGNAYMSGSTYSTDFPTASPLQPTHGGGGCDAFVTKVNVTGSALTYSTYLGGGGEDFSTGIGVDPSGNAYVRGYTDSTDFPTTVGVFQAAYGGTRDVFVAKLNADGSDLVYSSYLGGSDRESGSGFAVDSDGNAYVSGYTKSTDFPTTPGAFKTTGDGYLLYVTKVSPAGSSLVYSTLVGSANGYSVAVDAHGNAYVTGGTSARDFPQVNAFQTGYGGGISEAIVTKLNADGSDLVYSSYLGGSGSESGSGIAVDGDGNAYVTGTTGSTNFPTVNPLQPAHGGGSTDAFVIKLGEWPAGVFTVNTNDDIDDGKCDATHCSLREAINAANANVGTDTIGFNIPGTGPHTIQPTSALPTITDMVIIDGYTQPGATTNTNGPGLGINAVLMIELDGSDAGVGVSGLRITAGNSTVRGLVINRFNNHGIALETNGSNVIEGNFIGTNVTGTTANANGSQGIFILGVPNNIIGGTIPEARNLISGNDSRGISFQWNGATGNVVQGNFIGTDATGTAPLGNGFTGVGIIDGDDNTIGGTAAGMRNVISGNDGFGVRILGTGARWNIVQGNFIGTDVTGMADLGNSSGGIKILNGDNNTIGGATDGAGNLISGNDGDGIEIGGTGGYSNVIQGNFIGTDVTGMADLGNGSNGILIESRNNTIGGATSGAGNTITFNGGDGVFVADNYGNAILSNSIFSNAGLGIDLGTDGVTPNDIGDGDTGANNLQNFPVLTSAISGSTTIDGTLNSTPNTQFRLEFFSNSACDPSGHGEGEVFLGSTDVMTDDSGNVTFTVNFPETVPAGQFITATATDPDGNTSEFSQCVQVIALEPDIRTPIDTIDFGDVEVGSSQDETTTIYNDGSNTLTINTITRISGSAEFTYVDPSTPFDIAAGDSQAITIRFAPTSAGAKSATFNVNSNDSDDPDVTFDVSGNVIAPAIIDFDPDTLNVKSKGKWITCYIEFPEGYNVQDIDIDTVMLNTIIAAETHPTEIGDYDSDGVSDLMVKFDRASVQAILEVREQVEIIITGEVAGVSFEGVDTIRVIDKGKGK